MKIIRIFVFSILFYTLSCNTDKEAPTLEITTPTEGTTITGAVNITGKVTDKGLHQMTVRLLKDTDGVQLFQQVITEIHDLTSYNFNVTFTPTGITALTGVTLVIDVEDHTEHKTTKAVRFKLNP